jgi:hypothetical protein
LIGTGGSGGLINSSYGNQVGVTNPGLGPLTNNGGPTRTRALLPCSPAINAGNNAQAPGTTDQRGAPFVRIANTTVDIGAYEVQPLSASLEVGNNTDDVDASVGPGALSLREAICLANANAGPDTITFDSGFFSTPRVITLSQGQLGLRSDLTITGPGANLLSINGNGAGRVLDVTDFSPSMRVVAISGITITGGSAPTYSGGGIINRENLTIHDSTISGNSAGTSGGGIMNFAGASLSVQNSIVSNNLAGGDGGGIYNQGDLTMQNSTVTDNRAALISLTFSGGGLFNGNAALATITGSTFARNEAAYGGGLRGGGTLSVTNSTISANRAQDSGGGVVATIGTTQLTHVTVTNNRADSDANGSGLAGGVFRIAADVILNHAIVADNFRGAGGNEDNLTGAVNLSSGFNLIGTGGNGGLTHGVNGNQVGVPDPMLGPLANNGGPTQTHALLSGGPAVNTGDPGFVPPPDFDQRGAPFFRVASARIDIGAVEFQSITPDGDFNDDGLYDGLDIDALVEAIASDTHPPAFDLTGDALVNLADRDAWLAEAGGVNLGPGRVYRLGDANLDSVVDGSDFGIWNANKFTAVAQWTRGDFSADGVVDGSDFGIWNANKFTSSNSSRHNHPSLPLPRHDRNDVEGLFGDDASRRRSVAAGRRIELTDRDLVTLWSEVR